MSPLTAAWAGASARPSHAAVIVSLFMVSPAVLGEYAMGGVPGAINSLVKRNHPRGHQDFRARSGSFTGS